MAGKELIKADEDEHVIQPQSTTPAADTSDWPLLLKNYDKRTDYLDSLCSTGQPC